MSMCTLVYAHSLMIFILFISNTNKTGILYTGFILYKLAQSLRLLIVLKGFVISLL